MPLCRHCNKEMDKERAFYALTMLEKKEGKAHFMPDHGIPLTVFKCSSCGYLEIYSAPARREW
ncbi:MAG: hypothetical protein ACUVXI_01225 [bacterium]